MIQKSLEIAADAVKLQILDNSNSLERVSSVLLNSFQENPFTPEQASAIISTLELRFKKESGLVEAIKKTAYREALERGDRYMAKILCDILGYKSHIRHTHHNVITIMREFDFKRFIGTLADGEGLNGEECGFAVEYGKSSKITSQQIAVVRQFHRVLGAHPAIKEDSDQWKMLKADKAYIEEQRQASKARVRCMFEPIGCKEDESMDSCPSIEGKGDNSNTSPSSECQRLILIAGVGASVAQTSTTSTATSVMQDKSLSEGDVGVDPKLLRMCIANPEKLVEVRRLQAEINGNPLRSKASAQDDDWAINK